MIAVNEVSKTDQFDPRLEPTGSGLIFQPLDNVPSSYASCTIITRSKLRKKDWTFWLI